MFPGNLVTPYVERLIAKGDLEAAECALREYLEIWSYVEEYDKKNPNATGPGYLFLILISKCVELGKNEQAQALMDWGYSLPFIKDHFITSGLLKGTIEKGSLSEFIELVESLDAKKLVNHVAIYTLIINHLIKVKQFDSAMHWYMRGCANGLESEEYMFCCGLQLYSYVKRVDEFMKLYLKGRTEYKIKLNHAILSVLCDSAGYMLTVEELERFWKDALQDELVPNENNYSTLVEAYWRLGKLDRAVEVLLKEMPRAGFIPSYYMLRVLTQTAAKQDNQELLNLLKEARAKYAHAYKKRKHHTLV
jgi:pentatricopeptide repeat protein